MLRFFTVYGPRQRPDLAIHKFTRLIDAAGPSGVATAARARSQHITDILEGIVAARSANSGLNFQPRRIVHGEVVRTDCAHRKGAGRRRSLTGSRFSPAMCQSHLRIFPSARETGISSAGEG